MGPAEVLPGGIDFLGSESAAVHGVGAGFVRRPKADGRSDLKMMVNLSRPELLLYIYISLASESESEMCLYEGGFISDGFGLGNRGADLVVTGVAIVDADDVPAEGVEAGGDVLGEGEVGAAVDGDSIVVVESDELAESPVPGQRGSFVGHSLHLAAVPDDHVPAVLK